MEILKTRLCLLLFCFVFGPQQTQSVNSNPQTLFHGSTRSNLEENLLYHKWEDEELPCLQKSLDILRNLKNHTLWATWIWDSMQSPTGVLYGTRNQLGNFEQCINPPWIHTHPELRTQYCLAVITLTGRRQIVPEDPFINANEYVSSASKYKVTFNKLTWGICLPAICKPNSIKKFTKTFLNNSHLDFALPETTISIDYCQSYNERREVSYGYYATFTFIGSMILLTILCTNYYENHRYDTKKTRKILIARAFSAVENTAELFKEKDEAISCLNSMKFLSSCLILFMHSSLLCIEMGIKNSRSLDGFIDRNSLHVFFHLDILVDIFFMISGILLIKSFSATDKPVTINTIIRRYFRLTYLPMVVILFATQVLEYYISGPLVKKKLLFEVENCRHNWWAVLLAVNNYVDFKNTCLLYTWSNACDFHLTIFGTGLYWLYQRDRSLGVKAYFIGAVASIVLPTLVAFQNGLGPINYSDLEKIGDYAHNIITPTYLYSHLRSGPYFIGLAFGLLLNTFKPANYKKLPVNISTIIFTLGFGLGLFVLMFGGHLANTNYTAIEAALYVGTNRTIWAIAAGIFIISCEYGYIPLVTDFFNWSIFVPLSKLSFSMYLTHWIIMLMKNYNTMSPEMWSLGYLAIDSLGVITFCCGLSYLLWLVFEAPMNNVVAIVLRKRSRNGFQNETSPPNEIKEVGKKIT